MTELFDMLCFKTNKELTTIILTLHMYTITQIKCSIYLS